MAATIYHNPSCGTSRNVLAMLRDAGEEPEIIEYLKTPPSRATLQDLLRRAGLKPSEAVRRKQPQFAELGLDKPGVTEDRILDAMVSTPILIERPIVVTGKGVRLCRPKEKVQEIL
ncbi:arsenate reductase (glutaredoxin) [Rhodopila sp.]|uniref:arsenate reductase (glutaredoxin) n=1 Tax=Rhodopila sp. TaxID=2480087 RepID=UPI002CFA4D80|nr:arsenate reductase (glutaredoxin) [Rhodopila sp.]HVZ10243.1 arsenate reductase (glutaredoxin) [Rhodopila sp.]